MILSDTGAVLICEFVKRRFGFGAASSREAAFGGTVLKSIAKMGLRSRGRVAVATRVVGAALGVATLLATAADGQMGKWEQVGWY